MQTEKAFCAKCKREVQLTWTAAPLHEGHANLGSGDELVCLELGDQCTDDVCCVSRLPRQVMALRLAKSELRERPFSTTKYPCQGCGQETEMQILDQQDLYCTVCGTMNHWIAFELADQRFVTLPQLR